MDFPKFLTSYWGEFISHICQFHPIDPELLERYEYEWDWNALSQSRLMRWSETLIVQFEHRWRWDLLAMNPSIVWESHLIQRFSQELNWDYLGRNRSLPISSSFIQSYRKQIQISEDNVHLTEDLIQEYGMKLKPKSADPEELLSDLVMSRLEAFLISRKSSYGNRSQNYLNLYTDFIQPNLSGRSIRDIMEKKFDYSQRYFQWLPVTNDLHGSVPEFRFQSESLLRDRQLKDDLLPTLEDFILTPDRYREGPPRFYEVMKISGGYQTPMMLVSENVKALLAQFQLPVHCFLPVSAELDGVEIDRNFFLFQVEYDSIRRLTNYPESTFEQVSRRLEYGSEDRMRLDRGQVGSSSEKDSWCEMVRKRGAYACELIAVERQMLGHHDLFTQGTKIVVNQYLKEALDRLFAHQMRFASAQKLRLKIDQAVYDQKAHLILNAGIPLKSLSSTLSEELQFLYQKADRLRQEDPPFSAELPSDEFEEIQRKLNVIFPDSFKKIYRLGNRINPDFPFLPIDRFCIQSEYVKVHPESVKALIVAENGAGDQIGLLLDRAHDHRLGGQLCMFLHETGEILPIA
ncbi:SMI1/KNR4 family protein [Pontibacter sp. G13]|uniref:SMI1/KNR4 family protein n=1 Tax=Pontibacter sp. G13 TaxID=3074898 RepID=UPI00288A85B7|nr:SMI1/KNR4 family protein [Pontibacter sp. G13]WNJ18681.1 SMI1/KNR4 family protein [Pontibacter sp. G13]